MDPLCFFLVPVSAHQIRDKDSTEPKMAAEEVETAYMLAIDTFVPEWAKKLDSNSWRAIVAFNRAWFEQNKDRTMWVQRAGVFEKFIKAVEKL